MDTAEAGVEAMADFIKECGIPTKMSELKSKVEICKACYYRLGYRKGADDHEKISSPFAGWHHDFIFGRMQHR